jgi:hypothetical protein
VRGGDMMARTLGANNASMAKRSNGILWLPTLRQIKAREAEWESYRPHQRH